MLEMGVHQGCGLQRMALQAAPRVMALASHGHEHGELPLLWSLCATLDELGYSVAVLDASAAESVANPGLLQLLDDSAWRGDEEDAPWSWSVIPAALGLERLCVRPSAPGLALAPLGGLLEGFGVIVIYAGAEVLSRLLPDSGVSPLLTVSARKMSAVTAYQALKQMLLNAGLRPTIATWADPSGPESTLACPPPVHKLQECSMNFLDYRPDSLAVRAPQAGHDSSDDMHRLALRLLENAMPLPRHLYGGSH